MIRILPVALSFVFAALLSCIAGAQPARLLSAPKDKFSKAFLKVYKEAPGQFAKVKSRKVKNGSQRGYALRRMLPGSKSGFLVKGDTAFCIFKFNSYDALADAEEEMLKLSAKITYALLQRSMIKYIDSSQEQYMVKRTAIAEVKDGGFYGYNILVDVKKNETDPKYTVQLTIKGGKGTLYRSIYRNEPVRSTLFRQTFDKIYTQFNSSDQFFCNELLPGFECTMIDSAGKEQLMMEKEVQDFPDARVAFEALTTNLRAVLGGKFLYYVPDAVNKVERKVVFIQANDYELTERKSISTYLVRKPDNGYSVKVIMYHP